MKTIEVSDEMYEQLMALSNEMNTQDHRCTAMPYFFQVREEKRIDGVDGDYSIDGHVWVSPYGDGVIEADRQSMAEALGNLDVMFEKDISDEGLEDLMEKNEFYKGYFRTQEVYSNAFLTEKACKEHIRANHYHYIKPVDYLSHAFRNPDMELICKFICGLTGKEIHT